MMLKMQLYIRRMDNPTNSIVDKLGFRERLMATLMSNDPETSREEAGPEAVEGPERETSEPVSVWVGKLNYGGVNERVEVGCRLVDATNHEAVPNAVPVNKQGAKNSMFLGRTGKAMT